MFIVSPYIFTKATGSSRNNEPTPSVSVLKNNQINEQQKEQIGIPATSDKPTECDATLNVEPRASKSGEQVTQVTRNQKEKGVVPQLYVPYIPDLRTWFNIFLETIRQEKAKTDIGLRTPPIFTAMQKLSDDLPSDSDIECDDDIPLVYQEIMKGEEHLTFHEITKAGGINNLEGDKYSQRMLCNDLLKLNIQEDFWKGSSPKNTGHRLKERTFHIYEFGKNAFPPIEVKMAEDTDRNITNTVSEATDAEDHVTHTERATKNPDEDGKVSAITEALIGKTNSANKEDEQASLHIYVKESTSHTDPHELHDSDVSNSGFEIKSTQNNGTLGKEGNNSNQNAEKEIRIEVNADELIRSPNFNLRKELVQLPDVKLSEKVNVSPKNPLTCVSLPSKPKEQREEHIDTNKSSNTPSTPSKNEQLDQHQVIPIDMRKSTLDKMSVSDCRNPTRIGNAQQTETERVNSGTECGINEEMRRHSENATPTIPVPNNEVEIYTTDVMEKSHEEAEHEEVLDGTINTESVAGKQNKKPYVNLNLLREEQENRMLQGFWKVGHVTNPQEPLKIISEGREGEDKERHEEQVETSVVDGTHAKSQTLTIEGDKFESTQSQKYVNKVTEMQQTPATSPTPMQPLSQSTTGTKCEESEMLNEKHGNKIDGKKLQYNKESQEGESAKRSGEVGQKHDVPKLPEPVASDKAIETMENEQDLCETGPTESDIERKHGTPRKKTLEEIFPESARAIVGGNASPSLSFTSTESALEDPLNKGSEQKERQSCSKRSRRKKNVPPMRMLTRKQAADKNIQM